MDKRLKYLNALRSFESAARHQSYSKAAEELFVSQAAISQQMRQLEQALSVKLFLRNGRAMQLTDSGSKLFQSTNQAFSTLIGGLNTIQAESIAGELTLTSTQAFCSLWLMPRIYKFSLQHPDITIRILASNQIENLQKKHLDLAIRFGNQNIIEQSSLITENFGEDVVYPVCSPKLLEKQQLQSPEDLLHCKLVSLAHDKVITWGRWFEHAGVTGYEQHKNKIEVTSTDMALSAVLTGHGVALSASAMSAAYIHSKQLVIPFKIEHPGVWKRYLVYDENSAKLERIKTFTQWLQLEMAMSEPKMALR